MQNVIKIAGTPSRWVEIPRINHIYNIGESRQNFRLIALYKNGDCKVRSTVTNLEFIFNSDKLRYLRGKGKFEDIRKCGKPILKAIIK